jgi:hypothetical protein
LGSEADHVPDSAQGRDLYVTTYKDIVVDLTSHAVTLPSPAGHAEGLLEILMREFGSKPMTPRAIRKRYLEACRDGSVQPYRWMMVARPLYRQMEIIYGEKAFRARPYLPTGRDRKRARVYRIPTFAECEAALAALGNPDQVVAMHQRG